MRIAVLSTNFPPERGGIAELSVRICEQLAKRHSVTVLTNHVPVCSATQHAQFSVNRVFDPVPFATTRGITRFFSTQFWTRTAKNNVLRELDRLRADVLCCLNYHALLTRPVLRECHMPYVLYLHGGDLTTAMASPLPWRRSSLRRSIDGAAWTFCNSTFGASLVAELCGRRLLGVSVTGCGVPLESILSFADRSKARQALGWNDAPVLLTVARLVDNKGIDNVLKSLLLIRRHFPDCRYVIAGDGPLREPLRSLAHKEGISHAVDFLGFVDDHVRSLLYQAADLYVMTSRQGRFSEIEGFGISFLEANAHGLAVVGSRVGGICDAVEDQVNGRLVGPDDPADLAHVVVEMLAQPGRREAMAQAGQQRIKSRFNWPLISEIIEQRLLAATQTPASTT